MRPLRGPARLLLGLAFALGLGLLALGWRLAQGPLALPLAAAALERLAAERGVALRIGAASLAWDGWRGEHASPLVLRIEAPSLEGLPLRLAAAEAALSPGRILRGALVPEAVVLRGPSLVLEIGADGRPVLLPPGGGGTDDPLAAIVRRPDPGDPLAALREVRIVDGAVRLLDPSRGLDAALSGVSLTLRRDPGGALALEGEGAARLEGAAVPWRLEARGAPGRDGGPPSAEARLRTALNPAALAAAVAAGAPVPTSPRPSAAAAATPASVLARLAALDADVSLDGRLRWADGRPEGSAALLLGPGRLTLPGSAPVPFRGGSASLSGTAGAIRLDAASLALSAPPGAAAPGPTLTASGGAAPAGGHWRGALEVALDRLAAADLDRYWPAAVAPGGRGWIVANLSGGTARDGRWRIALAADPAPRVEALSGTLEVEDATLHWLRPVAPLEHVAATIRFPSAAEITVEARGRQRGTALAVSRAEVRITGLGTSEAIVVDGRVAGPAADVVELLRHPRLRLFERRPLDLRQPAGHVEATLHLAFPLLSDLPAELIRVRAGARITNARLAELLAGQPLERGTLELSVDNEGLRASGVADLGPIRQARLGVEMDFRPGPPGQVVARHRVEGRTEVRALEAFGLDLGGAARGPISGSAVAEQRRAGETRVALRGDLREVGLELEPLGWSKPAGVPGSGEATLVVREESLRAVEDLRIESADLSARGRVLFGEASRFRRLEFTEARFGASRMSGALDPPARPGEAWRVSARGPVLDLRAAVAKLLGPGADGAPAGARTPVAVRAEFERVILGAGELRGLGASGRTDAQGVVRELRAHARHGERGSFEATVTPNPDGGRSLLARAEGLGEILRAAGVLDEVSGGRLALSGTWRGGAASAPLLGLAELEEFSVRDAPGVAKLLQALTVYGIPEALRGPGLHFSRLHAPFALTAEALGLEDAQAYSASLGLTVRGRILRGPETLELGGTLVPAYFFNSLLGRLPVLGRLFSAEEGGGLFAARFAATGPLRDPVVSVNPLSALTPGALRGLFGAIDVPPAAAPAR